VAFGKSQLQKHIMAPHSQLMEPKELWLVGQRLSLLVWEIVVVIRSKINEDINPKQPNIFYSQAPQHTP
jgi:hypothetical protein